MIEYIIVNCPEGEAETQISYLVSEGFIPCGNPYTVGNSKWTYQAMYREKEVGSI